MALHASPNTLQRYLQTLVDLPEISIAVLASHEGRLVNKACDDSAVDAYKLASLSGLMASMAGQFAPSAKKKRSDIVCICDLGGSPMIVIAIGSGLLSLIGRHGANMGRIVAMARDVAKNIPGDVQPSGYETPTADANEFTFDAEGLTARVLAAIKDRDGYPKQNTA